MTPPVRLTPAAVQDVMLAERWYLEEAPHVVASFLKEIDETLGRIVPPAPALPGSPMPSAAGRLRRAGRRAGRAVLFPRGVLYSRRSVDTLQRAGAGKWTWPTASSTR